MSSLRSSPASRTRVETEISTLLAVELGLEYASLRAPNNSPPGMYMTPSPETILRWHGVYFVHRGPYEGSILRFALIFPVTFPQTPPSVRFDSDVFHPMVDPKTKVWVPRGRPSDWQPRIDHISQFLHHLKSSFMTHSLRSITEDEAVNKQIWRLYHHSPQTFRSMTSRRALHSTSPSTLYPPEKPVEPSQPPGPPTTPPRKRQVSGASSVSEEEVGPIRFREIGEEERGRLWDDLKRSLGIEVGT